MIWKFVVVGCGGTGSAFLQKLARFQYSSNENIRVLIVDGDIVEKKNLKRQNFFECNINRSKAESLLLLASSSYGIEWSCVNEYLTDAAQIDDYFESLGGNNVASVNILVGCVDNHRARQVMEQWFDKSNSCFYLDSANDEFDGEIVISIKSDHKEISPRRSYYYPEVLTDKSPSVTELSCEQRNISSPQHQLVNDLAGNILMSVVCRILRRDVPTGQILFDCNEYKVKHLSFIDGKVVI
jgi:molybdopterin/thiamine biosynthesis adenylyltransferase